MVVFCSGFVFGFLFGLGFGCGGFFNALRESERMIFKISLDGVFI